VAIAVGVDIDRGGGILSESSRGYGDHAAAQSDKFP
jgi:hypothetical protein